MKRLGPDLSGSRPSGAVTQHNFGPSDVSAILRALATAGVPIALPEDLRIAFLNYLDQQGFAPRIPDWSAKLRNHFADFAALHPDRFSPALLDPVAGAAPQPFAPPEPPEMLAVAQNDVNAIRSFLTQDPLSLAHAQVDVECAVFGPHGVVTVTSPTAGYSPITYAVVQDGEVEGGLATICMWINEERGLNNPHLPPNILDFTDAHGQTPLTTAVLIGASPACVHALISAGAGVNAANAEGMTALALAVQRTDLQLVTALLDHSPLVPIGLADPIDVVRYMRDIEDPDGQMQERVPPTAEQDAILVLLLDAALADLQASVADLTAPPAEVVAKFLSRWEQVEFFGESEAPNVVQAVQDFYANLPVMVHNAFETLFCHDIALARRLFCPLVECQIDGFVHKLFHRVMRNCCRVRGEHDFDNSDLYFLAELLDNSAKEYFRGKPELTATFLTFLTDRKFKIAERWNETDENELKGHVADFRRLVVQTQEIPRELQAVKDATKDIKIRKNDGEDLAPLTRALFQERSREEICKILNERPLSLYEQVLRVDSREWIGFAARASEALLEGNLSANQYAEGVIARGFVKYPEFVHTQPANVMRRHPVAGASPLTFAVVQDPQADGALSEICMWIVDQRDQNPDVAQGILDFTDFQGNTPLTVAVQENHPACVDVLLSSGAAPNGPDAWGRTPLMRAAWAANERMVYKLLNRGANPIAFHNGASAISLAVMNTSLANSDTMTDIIHELLLSGPEHLERLLASGTPYAIAAALAEGLCSWLSLAQSLNPAVREMALTQLRILPSKAPNACTTLFLNDQELGLRSFMSVLELISDLTCAEGDDLANLVSPIYMSMWDQAIGAASLKTLLALLTEARKRAGSAGGGGKIFAAHPNSADLEHRILTRIPQLASQRLESGELDLSAECLAVRQYIEDLDHRSFHLDTAQCARRLSELMQRESAYKQMFAALGAAGAQYFISRERRSWFIAEIDRRGVNPRDAAAVKALFSALTAPADSLFGYLRQ